jgi:hypothetical protein
MTLADRARAGDGARDDQGAEGDQGHAGRQAWPVDGVELRRRSARQNPTSSFVTCRGR